MASPEVKRKHGPDQKKMLGFCEGFYDYQKKKKSAKGGSEPSWDADVEKNGFIYLPDNIKPAS